jgi:hypothetical protein
MTYSSGSLILASDYNVFTTSLGGLNNIWGTGSNDQGWGQTNFVAQTTGNTVTATQWATLVNNLATSGSQTNTTITSRTAPVTGNIIGILANVQTDINNCTTNRGNAAASGAEYGTFTGDVSKTTGTGTAGPGQNAWTITFTQTVTFPTADQTRYFFNAGGRVRLQFGKSSTGAGEGDTVWNAFVPLVGSLYLTGRVNTADQTIAGVTYSGTTRIGGTGGTVNTLSTATGWYNLTGTPTTIFQLNNSTYPYVGEYIRVTATATSSTVLTLVTTWVNNGGGLLSPDNISGGTAVSSPATSIGAATAPTTLLTYFPPSTTYLSNSWGTPTIASSVA